MHPQAGVIISGGRNSMDMGALLQIDRTLRQAVNKPTRGYKILDVILSNLHSYYDVPEIVPPIPPDVPGKGAPSDHWGVHCHTSHKLNYSSEKAHNKKNYSTNT